MSSYLKILLLVVAIFGLSWILSGGEILKTWAAFACISFLVLHLEWQIEGVKTKIHLHANTIIHNGPPAE